jgi:hypothetical protein
MHSVQQNGSTDRRVWLWNVPLAIVLALLLGRLAILIVTFGNESLQMAFSAFYAAGQAVEADLSPYVNHVERVPPIWDGVDTYRHSRFLYPPLVARVFRPLTLLSYHQAKFVWMLSSLVALGWALWFAARAAGLSRRPRDLLIIGIVAAAFFPLLTLLERGQIDSVTMLLLVVAIVSLRGGARVSFAAGVLLSVATLLKLHCVFLVPFLVIRKRWWALGGLVGGGAVLLLLSLVLDGRALVYDYLTRELPRISRYGERGSREMRLPPQTLRPIMETIGTGRTVMDGRQYDIESLRFVLNASAVRTPLGRATWAGLKGLGFPVAPAQVSLVFLGVFLVGLVAWQRWFGVPEGPDRDIWDLVYWQAVLVIILLCAPVTWAMSTVWLLPIAAIVMRELPRLTSRAHVLSVFACALGLFVAGIPDTVGGAVVRPLGERVMDAKYIVAELLCMIGLLGLWCVYDARRRDA